MSGVLAKKNNNYMYFIASRTYRELTKHVSEGLHVYHMNKPPLTTLLVTKRNSGGKKITLL